MLGPWGQWWSLLALSRTVASSAQSCNNSSTPVPSIVHNPKSGQTLVQEQCLDRTVFWRPVYSGRSEGDFSILLPSIFLWYGICFCHMWNGHIRWRATTAPVMLQFIRWGSKRKVWSPVSVFHQQQENTEAPLSSSCWKATSSDLSVTKLHLWAPSQQKLWQRGKRVWQFYWAQCCLDGSIGQCLTQFPCVYNHSNFPALNAFCMPGCTR